MKLLLENVIYNGGQKCWDLFSDISKTSKPSPLPPQIKLNFEQMGGIDCFIWPQHCWGGEWGDDGISPKLIKKLSLGAESYVTVTWKGFFTQSQVLFSFIVVLCTIIQQPAKKVVSHSPGPMGKSSFLRNSHDRITVLNQFCSPKVLGLVEMTSGLLNATFSFPEAVKLTFFALCTCT